jgi:hypothetical protein
MLAEARGHAKQETSEMFYELKEKAKADVAASREKAEKALLDMIPESSMLDWQKAFKAFTKDATPAEPKEKDLFKTEVPEKAHDFEHPSEDKFKLPKDADKAIPGNGREADERTDATKEAGVTQESIVEGTSKEASLKTAAPQTPSMGAPMDENVIREAFKQLINGAGEDVLTDLLMQFMPADAMQNMLDEFSDEGTFSPNEEHYEHAGVPMAVSFLKFQFNKIAAGCPVCSSTGKDLKNGQKEHMACEACGLTYAKASLETEAETDSHKLKRLRLELKELNPISDMKKYKEVLHEMSPLMDAKEDAIKSHASKEQVIKKVAELQKTAEVASPWAVTTDENGQEVIARVDQPTNSKESEEIKTDDLIK